MEGGMEVGLVLARASELRAKLNHCILDRAARRRCKDGGAGGCVSGVAEGVAGGREGRVEEGEDEDKEEEEEEEEEAEEEEEEASLLDIRDALESLEQQLSSLQALEQQQRYETEATLAQIDRCRMFLLSKIVEHKGEGLEVIQEALNFAGGNVKNNDDLLLPPYSNHAPDAFILDDLYPSSHVTSKRRHYQYGLAHKSMHESKTSMDESRMKHAEPVAGNILKGVKFTLGLVVKSAITFASVMSILSLAGFDPRLGRKGSQFKLLDLFERRSDAEEHGSDRCPPGKVLVTENGESRCVVKERVEVPFDPVGPAPNVSYGLG